MSKIFSKIGTVIGMVALAALPFSAMSAQSVTDLSKQQSAYAAQAEQARKLAAQKAQEAAALQQQVTAVSGQIDTTQKAISLTLGQISSTQAEIDSLVTQIQAKQDEINSQNDKLNKVMASWYMQGESGFMEALLNSSTFSDAINQQQYYDAINQQVRGMLDQLAAMKTDLAGKKSDQENKLAGLSDLKQTQSSQKSYLESQQNTKNKLLTNAKDAVSDLNAQAAAAEAKAAELRKIIASIYSSGKGSPKGDSLVQDTSWGWYYSQRDPSWSGNYLSPSRMTIGEVGCLVTSMAMVATYHGHHYTPADIATMSSFDDGGAWRWFDESPGVTVNGSQPKNWDVINSELENHRPVIVSVKVNGPVYNADGSNHFIVISGISGGKYLIHDPYWTDSSYSLSNVISMKLVRPN